MTVLHGIAASAGIAIARAFVLHDDENPKVPRYAITLSDVESEWSRFINALGRAREEIIVLRDKTKKETGDEQSAIFDSHLLMLDDPDLHNSIQNSLKSTLYNIEWVLYQYAADLIQQIEMLDNPILQERSSDIYDVTHRILNHLMYRERFSLADINHDIVLIAHNLLPSDIVSMNKKHIKALVMDAGGKTSHTAILARAFEIPAVLGLGNVTQAIKNDELIIVDGDSGVLYVNPEPEQRAYYDGIIRKKEQALKVLLSEINRPATTLDGKICTIKANIEIPEETAAVKKYGAEGIGLFRSEFLFLQSKHVPDEEAQFQAYKKVLEDLAPKPVTIRTLDLGGDKVAPELFISEEKNPLLGWRAIRYCLSDTELFQTQLRALLRASVYGELKIMFPMISGVQEVELALEQLEQAKEYCRSKDIVIKDTIPVGIMIEIPSAALIADILAQKVNFFSIGTNDLIQYTIAVDRGNEKVAYLHDQFHPAVLRLIRHIIEEGHKAGISVGMCGEMASDPLALPLLLGFGLDEFSMSAISVPRTKQIIRSLQYNEAKELAEYSVALENSAKIVSHIKNYLSDKISDTI
ncbi:MAG TPA: phosphoenolpyruvate--protein phosphotransferase [Spirochaetales bacterium]|nr:phosphoenolpyruvate--protein phosphotransferase [Spirochaetales bacterium]